MNQLLETTSPPQMFLRRILTLVLGDVAVFGLFVLIGRDSHRLSMTDIGAISFTLAPFLMAWFLIMPWFGLFRDEVSRSWSKLLPRLLIAWVLIGGPLSLILWALFRQRPIPGGIIPIFAVITLTVTTLFMIIWRLSYAWWLNRFQVKGRGLS